jgi:hypothetical protein
LTAASGPGLIGDGGATVKRDAELPGSDYAARLEQEIAVRVRAGRRLTVLVRFRSADSRDPFGTINVLLQADPIKD